MRNGLSSPRRPRPCHRPSSASPPRPIARATRFRCGCRCLASSSQCRPRHSPCLATAWLVSCAPCDACLAWPCGRAGHCLRTALDDRCLTCTCRPWPRVSDSLANLTNRTAGATRRHQAVDHRSGTGRRASGPARPAGGRSHAGPPCAAVLGVPRSRPRMFQGSVRGDRSLGDAPRLCELASRERGCAITQSGVCLNTRQGLPPPELTPQSPHLGPQRVPLSTRNSDHLGRFDAHTAAPLCSMLLPKSRSGSTAGAATSQGRHATAAGLSCGKPMPAAGRCPSWDRPGWEPLLLGVSSDWRATYAPQRRPSHAPPARA